MNERRAGTLPEESAPEGLRAGGATDPLVAGRLRVLAILAGSYAVLGGAITLVGWFADLPGLTSWDGNGISMMPNTAVAAIAAGAALILLAFRRLVAGGVLGALVALIGAATVFQYITRVNLGIDTLLIYRDWGQRGTLVPGRMGPPASVSFTLLGSAIALAAGGRAARRATVVVGLVIIGVAMLSMMGYLYGADTLYSLPYLTTIALQTSSILMALAIGLLALSPDIEPMRILSGRSGGAVLMRRVLPLVLLLPIVVGTLRVAGERAGFYEAAFGTALRTLVEVVLLMAMLWWTAKALGTHERALQENERQARAMIDGIPAAIYTTDAQGRLTYFNPAAVEFSGRTPELGTDHWCVTWKLYNPDGTPLPHDRCPMAVSLKEGRAVRGVEAIAERPDGKRIWFQPYPTPLFDGEGRVVGGINMLVDITDRKRAEIASSRLAAIVESSDDAIVSKGLDGVVTSWNHGAERIFGYTAAEAVGRHISFIIPSERRFEEDEVLARLRRGETIDHFETERQTKDGRRVNISLTVSPLKDGTGRIIGASKVARDITDRKRAEAALAAHQQSLERRVQERTRELVAAHERLRLSDRMAAVGTLAAGLAHDMKNVLLPLGVRLDAMLTSPGLTREASMDLAAVCALLDHLRAMARNLSLFAQDPEQEGTEGRTDPARWCAQVRGFIDASAGRSVVITWDVPEGLPAVGIAPHRLTQAVLNLVHNARDAIASARTPLAGTLSSGKIKVEARAVSSEQVVLKVIDNGCGMSQEVLRRCSEPFFTTKDRPATDGGVSGGTGLGLSLAYAIVERAGGGLEIESKVDEGTTITLSLPVAAPEPPAALLAPPGRARVTIADQRTRAVVGSLLGALRYEVLEDTKGTTSVPDGTLWVTDVNGATPDEAAAFLRRKPGSRVVALCESDGNGAAGNHRDWRAMGVEVVCGPPPSPTCARCWRAERPDPKGTAIGVRWF